MGDTRLLFGRPEHRCQAPVPSKCKLGDCLMSYEEMNVKIFNKNVFLLEKMADSVTKK